MKQNEISKLYNDLKPKNEVQNSFNFLFNSPTQKNKQKTFFIRKLDESDTLNEKINKEFTNYFENPDTYFSSNSNVRLGKKYDITDISLELKTNKKFLTKKNMLNISSCSRKKSIVTRLSKEKDRNGNNIIDNVKFEFIDNKRLGNIFNLYKERINSKRNKSYFNNNKNLPINLSVELNNQTKKLINQKYNNKINNNLSNYISKKIHENKEDLLISNTDNYLYKNEIIKKMGNNVLLNEINDRYKWVTSLRNSDKLKGIRKTLVNINSDKYPFWGFLVEKSPNMRQTSVRSGMQINNRNLKNFIKKAKSLKKFDDNCLNNLEEINIRGDNLLDIEYNREMSSKKRKILHKVFVVNGKALFGAEINNTFGKETFYKDYERNKRFFSPINYNKNRNKNIIITLSN